MKETGQTCVGPLDTHGLPVPGMYSITTTCNATFLFSKEGVTQGNPLFMVAYGLSLLPLIQQLKDEFPNILQPWYLFIKNDGIIYWKNIEQRTSSFCLVSLTIDQQQADFICLLGRCCDTSHPRVVWDDQRDGS
jgi:hypothetical protein